MSIDRELKVELAKAELWMGTARKQFESYISPNRRESGDYARYDYYLQTSATEASFALEHLVRAIHFYCRKYPEPSFQMTETLLADANRYLERAGQDTVTIESLNVLQAALALDEDVKSDVKVDFEDLERYLQSIEASVRKVKRLMTPRESVKGISP